MKPKKRDPIRFEVLNLYARNGVPKGSSLSDPQAIDHFVGQVVASLKRSVESDPNLLSGTRVQNMFEGLVRSIGAIRFLKQEDSGELFAPEECLEVPDFRLILADGSQILVEVKQFYALKDDFAPFTITESYYNGLLNYARLMDCRIMIAIFWARPRLWSLVPISAFKSKGRNRVLSLQEAMMQSDMASIGDCFIGTQFPLSMTIRGEKVSSEENEEGQHISMRLKEIEIYCKENQLLSPTEFRIAQYLMQFGKWREEGPFYKEESENMISIETTCLPYEDHQQGFEIIGSLSEMFTNFYLSATTSDTGDIEGLYKDVIPGALGQLIPDDYKSNTLPIWRLRLVPSPPSEKAVMS